MFLTSNTYWDCSYLFFFFLIYGIAKYMSIYVEIDMCKTSKARVVEKKDVSFKEVVIVYLYLAYISLYHASTVFLFMRRNFTMKKYTNDHKNDMDYGS